MGGYIPNLGSHRETGSGAFITEHAQPPPTDLAIRRRLVTRFSGFSRKEIASRDGSERPPGSAQVSIQPVL